MNFSFHPEAEEEFNKAIDYYEDIEPGLGYDFALEVYTAIQRAVKFPKNVASVGRRNQEMFGKAISLRNIVH